jgi:two-component system OmpR family response regulator
MPIRVLIADPDESLLAAYEAQLSHAGFDVATVKDGLDCLDMLRKFTPDVLVLEPEMPWGGGDGVLAIMHDVFELPLVPVFIITSSQSSACLDMKKFPLVSHMQTKPVGPDELVRLVRHIANEPRPSEEDLQLLTRRARKTTKQRGVRGDRASYLEASP